MEVGASCQADIIGCLRPLFSSDTGEHTDVASCMTACIHLCVYTLMYMYMSINVFLYVGEDHQAYFY